MIRKKFYGAKYFILGIIFALFFFGTVATAGSNLREIIYGVHVAFNNEFVQFDEGTEPFIMEGRTFLPVRTIAEMVELEVVFIDGVVHLMEDGFYMPVDESPLPPRSSAERNALPEIVNIG
ncbi:MAG: hypothetical protein LBI27_04715, partial [Clostridiales bacterium]|nr:hypothetical protein [Clostridiales bacterium]